MEKAQCKNTRKSSGVRNVSTTAFTTFSISEQFAAMLRPFSAKEIARRLDLPSVRTVENWKEGRTAPQARHVVAMLGDDVLCAKLLEAAGRRDLAKHHEITTLNRRIEALKADEQRHKEEAHVIRQDLALGRPRRGVDGGSSQRLRDTVATGGGVVPRQTEE